MPRFFFDTQDGFRLHDDEGHLLADLQAARREAIHAVSEMMANHEPRCDAMEFSCEVRNELSEVVYTAVLRFSGRWTEGNVDQARSGPAAPRGTGADGT